MSSDSLTNMADFDKKKQLDIALKDLTGSLRLIQESMIEANRALGRIGNCLPLGRNELDDKMASLTASLIFDNLEEAEKFLNDLKANVFGVRQ